MAASGLHGVVAGELLDGFDVAGSDCRRWLVLARDDAAAWYEPTCLAARALGNATVRESGDMARVGNRFDVHCESPSGQRWELAVERLDKRRYFRALVGDLGLYRHDNRPLWDRLAPLVVEIDVSDWWRGDPPLESDIKNEHAARAVASALSDIERLRSASDRLDELINPIGFLINLVYDYEDGAVLLARAEPPDFVARWAQPRQTLP